MNQPIFAVILNKKNVDSTFKNLISDKKCRIENYYRLSNDKNIRFVKSESRDITLLSWNSASHLKINLVESDSTYHAVSTHLPFGASISKSAKALEGTISWIKNFFEKMEKQPEYVFKLAPPQVMILHDIEQNECTMINDCIGFGKIYVHDAGDCVIWTNRIAIIPIISGTLPRKSSTGWATYSGYGWFLDDTTIFENVHFVSPGTKAKIFGSKQYFETNKFHSLEKHLETNQKLTSQRVDSVIEGLTNFFSDIKYLGQPIKAGLSGGRDSRVIGAMALHVGLDVEFVTNYPPNLELEIAEQLIGSLTMPVKWKKKNIHQKLDESNTDLEQRLDYWFERYEGESRPEVINRPPNFNFRFFSKKALPAILSGGGGDFAHPNFYQRVPFYNFISTANFLGSKFSTWKINSRMAEFFASRHLEENHISQNSKKICLDVLKKIVSEGQKNKIYGTYLLNWFYIFGKYRRWGSGTQDVNFLLPFLNKAYIETAFSMRHRDKFQSSLQKEIINRIMPAWKGIPFFHELRKSRSMNETNAAVNRPFIWAGETRSRFLDLIDGYENNEIYQKNPIDFFSKLNSEKTVNNVRNQHAAYRILWSVGYDRWVDRLQKHVQGPA